MRGMRFLMLALTVAVGATSANAQQPEALPRHEIRTEAYRSGGPAMMPYGETLHRLILDEVRRARLPFRQAGTFDVTVRFDLDRRGRLIHFSVLKGIGAKIVDDHIEQIVRRAARRFPPPPAGLITTDRIVLTLPFRFLIPSEDVRDGLGFPRRP